ncbi:DUF4192 domain-containing protein [Nocardia sp. NPDC058499]|uniref:DUF4192 domain-containing protein n=1 Tax=Nocardia sp. NPDC058499 TaxID=3346530 RepID=UPI00364D2792
MSHAHPDPGPRNVWPASLGPTCFEDPGDFIAVLPAMLGFLPERSLAVAVLCAGDGAPGKALIDLVVRFDLYRGEAARPADPATIAVAAARICARPEVMGVLAVVIDDSIGEPEAARAHSHPVLDALERRLAAVEVPVRAAWAVAAIAAGQPWWSLRGPQRSGHLGDPDTSIVAFRRVLDGRPAGSRPRSELTAQVTPDPALHTAVSRELDGAVDRANQRHAEAIAHDDGRRSYLTWQLENALRYVCHLGSAEPASARALAEVAVALREHEVRDSLFALADSTHAQAAEQFWARLTGAVSDEFRAEAATLLGYFAYVRGDGPLAGIALDAALDANPQHSMAALLETALEAGMHPDRLRDLTHRARETAAGLGVTIPRIE